MLLKITETCITDNNETGLRIYEYDAFSERDKFEEAVIDFINNFDTDNILCCEDSFEGECHYSEVVCIEIAD